METITSIAQLKNAIWLLELDQKVKEKLLREQFALTYESLKPINIIKNSLKDISTSPLFIDNILGAVLGMSTGYLSNKMVVGASGGIIRKIAGSVLQFGVANSISSHTDTLKSIGQYVFQHLFRRKKE